MTHPEQGSSDSGYVYFARVGVRVKAFLIDYFIVLGVMALTATVGANIPGTGAAAFGVALAFLLLYDPVMVWRTSGTVGHHLLNIKVVADGGGRPSLLAALVRNIVKVLLGVWSFLAMSGSRRHKTLHDWVARTTVQIREIQHARVRDYRRVQWPLSPPRA